MDSAPVQYGVKEVIPMVLAISIVLIISALIMIVSVLLQSADEEDMGSVMGRTSSSYFSKSKTKTFEARLALITKIAAALFVALSLLLLVVK